jgi:dihydrofolate reductase
MGFPRAARFRYRGPMGRLIYALNVSLDGFVETPSHSLDWADVDEEVHTWFNDVARETDAFLYGRGMYETMAAYWPHGADDPDATPAMRDFARIWNPTPKVVFSRSLGEVGWNSRLVRGGVAEELAAIRREFDGDLGIGGATLAASFIELGLVDVYRLVIHPVVLGAGTPFFPPVADRLRLRPTGSREFGNGVRALEYEMVRGGA